MCNCVTSATLWKEMHSSYSKRYSDWQRRKQELEMDIDLSRMSLLDKDKVAEIGPVPTKVEVSRMRDLSLGKSSTGLCICLYINICLAAG